MNAYTVTLAESKQGRYHISNYDPPFVPHDGSPAEGEVWSTFTPLCKAVATQRDTIWSNPDEASIMEVWQAFAQVLHQSMTCDKCERASWALMELEQLEAEAEAIMNAGCTKCGATNLPIIGHEPCPGPQASFTLDPGDGLSPTAGLRGQGGPTSEWRHGA